MLAILNKRSLGRDDHWGGEVESISLLLFFSLYFFFFFLRERQRARASEKGRGDNIKVYWILENEFQPLKSYFYL
jgi:hypothetical protein